MSKFHLSLPTAVRSWFSRSQDTDAGPRPPRNVPPDASGAVRVPHRTVEADRPIPRRNATTRNDLPGRPVVSLRERYVRWVAGREARATVQRAAAEARREQLGGEFKSGATALVQAVASGEASPTELAAVRRAGHALHGHFGSDYRRQLTLQLHRTLGTLSPDLRSRVVQNATAQIAAARWGAPAELRFIVAAGALATESEGRKTPGSTPAEGDSKHLDTRSPASTPAARLGPSAGRSGVGNWVRRLVGAPRPEPTLSPKFQAFNAWQRGDEEASVRIHMSSLSRTMAPSPARVAPLPPQEESEKVCLPLDAVGRAALAERLETLAKTRSELGGLRNDRDRFKRALEELAQFCGTYGINPTLMDEDDLVGYVAPSAMGSGYGPSSPDT